MSLDTVLRRLRSRGGNKAALGFGNAMFDQRFQSQTQDQALQFGEFAQDAENAQGAVFGSIAQRSDPNRYGSVASRQFPSSFGPNPHGAPSGIPRGFNAGFGGFGRQTFTGTGRRNPLGDDENGNV